MEGGLFGGDYEFIFSQTLVLVGRKGNGKSATGNVILGTNMFKSERSSSGVTTTCEMNSTKFKDGRMINVIDTPGIDINNGILGSSGETEFMEEVINMAGDGICAFLVILSIRSRFSKEEEAVISRLQSFYGSKIYDYMILVFTGGDQLDKDDETLEGFLDDCPEKLKEILNLCENRCVLFDNKTEDQTKRSDQVEKLFSIVNMMSIKNDGNLYNNEMLTEWKKEAKEVEKQAESSQALKDSQRFTEPDISMFGLMHEGQFKQMIEMKLRERTFGIEQQLAEVRAARLKAEEDTKAFEMKSDIEIRHLKQQISKRRQKVGAIEIAGCIIL